MWTKSTWPICRKLHIFVFLSYVICMKLCCHFIISFGGQEPASAAASEGENVFPWKRVSIQVLFFDEWTWRGDWSEKDMEWRALESQLCYSHGLRREERGAVFRQQSRTRNYGKPVFIDNRNAKCSWEASHRFRYQGNVIVWFYDVHISLGRRIQRRPKKKAMIVAAAWQGTCQIRCFSLIVWK